MTLRFNMNDSLIYWPEGEKPMIGQVKEAGAKAIVVWNIPGNESEFSERNQFEICNQQLYYYVLIRSGVAKKFKKYPKFKSGDIVEISRNIDPQYGAKKIYKKVGIVIELDSTKLLTHVYLQEDMKYVWAPIHFTKKV